MTFLIKIYFFKLTMSRCLKITEKISFNIASEASYVYILSGQKLVRNAKNCPFWRVFKNLKLAVKQCYQTNQWKNWWKMPKLKNQMRHFEEFLNNVNVVWLLVTDQYSLRPETFMEFANDESKVTFLFF